MIHSANQPADQFREEKPKPKVELPALRVVPQPWEQQIGEKPDRFRLFIAYRNMPKRSFVQLAKLVGLQPGTLKAYARDTNWASRCEAWDRELDNRVTAMLTVEIAEMRQRHIDTSMKMQAAADLEIAAHLKKIQAALQCAKEGAAAQAKLAGSDIEKAIQEAYHEPTLSMRDLISLLDHGTRLERLNRGEPTDRTETSSSSEAERTRAMLDNLSVEEKKRFLKLKQKAAGVDPDAEADSTTTGEYIPNNPAAQPLSSLDSALAPEPEPGFDPNLGPDPDEDF